MSYKKMMRHATSPNLNKGRNQYMGFDVSDGKTNGSPEARKILVNQMEVARWFKERLENGNAQRMRDCIRDSISNLRRLVAVNETITKTVFR